MQNIENINDIRLDCPACRTQVAMFAAKVPRFTTIVRMIAIMLLIPAALGILGGVFMFLAVLLGGAGVASAVDPQNSAAALGGAAIGMFIALGGVVVVIITSFAGSLVSWLLLMNKNVFRCAKCTHIIDRA